MLYLHRAEESSVTHHHGAPSSLSDLRPGDTVEMTALTNLETGAMTSRTPCCNRQVRIKSEDVRYMERRPGYRVLRYCAGCDWPYEVTVSHPGAVLATFTVKTAPR
jgi:hypothetical protein